MIKYYCNCLNICVQFKKDCDRVDDCDLSEEEKASEFFHKLPLIIVQHCIISERHTALIKLSVVGSWIIHKCVNCSMYTHAVKSDESSRVIINSTLKELTDEEVELMKCSLEFSPVFQVLIMDLLHPTDCGTSHLLMGESSGSLSELKEILDEKLEERRKITDKIIEKFVQEQQNALKEFIIRANDDFQSVKSAVLSNEKSEPKTTKGVNFTNAVINNNFDLSASPTKAEQKKDRNPSLSECQMSFDSEGLFLLDGVEENPILEDEDHSEEDLSDTDDSGSRDEGIHIPRRKSMAITRSLPIRVRADFDPSLRLFDDRFDENKGKPNYKRKMRNERPVDIAASMKALANSVHGDTIFGDLPPPRIGSRI